MKTLSNLRYTRTHEWVEFLEGDKARIGITDYAQNKLGSLVFVNLPEEGDELVSGESLGDVESVKGVSDINAPVSGTVIEVNEKLLEEPGLMNEDPYSAWLVTAENISDETELMNAEDYEAFCGGEA